jgi:hypothetical protein
MSDIRVAADTPAQSAPLPRFTRVAHGPGFNQQLQRALAAQSAFDALPPQAGPGPDTASSMPVPPWTADPRALWTASATDADAAPAADALCAEHAPALAAMAGADGLAALGYPAPDTGCMAGRAMPFQVRAADDGPDIDPDAASGPPCPQPAATVDDDAAATPPAALTADVEAAALDTAGAPTGELAAKLAELGTDDGVFEVFMPDGQHVAIAMATQPGSVCYLMNTSSEMLRDRIINCRMELQQSVARRIHRKVQIAVL